MSLEGPPSPGSGLPLSEDEHARARRFRRGRDRRAFVAARRALREILGWYVALPPAELVFEYNEYGKPMLAGAAARVDIRFNLSHAGSIALLAVARSHDVGVDVEVIDASLPLPSIAASTFSRQEVEDLGRLVPAELARGFYNCWTRKEAVVKALGLGLSLPLTAFDVSVAPGEEARLLASRSPLLKAGEWRLFDVTRGRGYVGAVAGSCEAGRVRILDRD